MATRTTEASNTLETFRVNFNGLVDDIGNVTVSSAGDQLATGLNATTVVGAINEIFAGMKLSAQINSHGSDSFLQSSNAETLTLQGGASVYTGNAQTTNIVTDITADDTMSFFLNDNVKSLVSLQATKLHPTSGDFVQFSNELATTHNDYKTYSVKFVSPGDTNLDFGSTQGFAAAMAVALG
jgi:hypothetical protein